MNAVEIEEAVSLLAGAPFNPEELPLIPQPLLPFWEKGSRLQSPSLGTGEEFRVETELIDGAAVTIRDDSIRVRQLPIRRSHDPLGMEC